MKISTRIIWSGDETVTIHIEDSIRVFIAIEVEDDAIREKFREVQSMLTNTGADLRFVAPENIHLTLKFLGGISTSLVEVICQRLNAIRFTPFQVQLQGLGAFPSLKHINVVWTAVTEGKDKLEEVQNQLETQLADLRVKQEHKGFTPHLTLARIRSGRNREQLSKLLQSHTSYPLGVFTAKAVKLKQSVLSPTGPIYTTLCETKVE